jgi:hypothetical protein
MKKILPFLVFILCFINIKANDTIDENKQNSDNNTLGVSISYFAESGYHHGFFSGIDYVFFNKEKEKKRKEGKFKNHKFILSPSIGLYNHPNNKMVLIIKADLSHRMTFNNGLFGLIGIGTGFARSFYNIPTYQIIDEELTKVKLAGRFSSVSNLSFGIGYDFKKKLDVPFSMMLQPELYIQTPYNHKYVLFPAWQMKLVYYFKSKH